MIHVDRSSVAVPEVLSSKRANAERARARELLQSSAKKLDQLRITFEPSIFLRTREALLELFHSKCAYCETIVDGNVPADVEHFRPKQGARTLDNTREHLHYAWLAYEWDNLLIACGACNRRRKQAGQMVGKADYFPVEGPRAPLLASVAECRALEKALLLDPTFDDPAEHLQFDGSTGTVTGLTMKGQVTVQLLGLNREELVDARRRTWVAAENAYREWMSALLRGDQERAARARKDVDRLLSPEHPYLAVVRLAVQATRGKIVAAAADPAPTPAPETPSVPRRYEKREELPPFAHDRIRRIEIRNFKTITSLDFDIRDPAGTDPTAGALMLLGENACGKSTVLEAVALALLGTKEIGNLSLRVEDFLHRPDWDAALSHAKPAEIRIFFESNEPVSLTIDPRKKKFSGNATPATILLGYGPRRFFTDQSVLGRISDIFLAPKASARVQTLFDPLAVINNPNEWLLTSPEPVFTPVVRALKQLLGLPDDTFIERPSAEKKTEMFFEVQGMKAPLGRLSDGYKTIVATGVDIMREMLRFWPELESASGVVLIDEIETHLHPRWKMRILERLRKAMPQVQFIVTTHDPLTLRGLHDGEAQVLARDGRHEIERVLDVPNVRGLSVEQLLTSEYFGLFSTEDPAVEEAMTRYVALATKSDRSKEENEELEYHRKLTRETLVVGSTPQSQAVYEAAGRYMLERRTRKPNERADLKRDSISRLVDLWKSAGSEETPE